MTAEPLRLDFDRGTLLLHGAAESELGELPGVRWDARVGCHRAPACFHAALREALGARLAAVRAGEIRAIVSARVLNEGFDVPDAEVGIVVGGAQGEREHVQRVGRLLRPAQKKRALVYELVTQDTAEVGAMQRKRRGLRARGAGAL